MVKNTYLENSKELKKLATDERDDIVNSFQNGTLPNSLLDRVLDVSFDDDGDPEYLYFTLESPIVYLTLASNKGLVFACEIDKVERSAISWFVWDDIEEIIFDFIEDHFSISGVSHD